MLIYIFIAIFETAFFVSRDPGGEKMKWLKMVKQNI